MAELPVNAELNRFPHLLAYDHSRVKLERPESDDDDSDYINANYVPGYDRRRKAYIAAQSPFNERTICDFWLMVYQQRVTKVTTASCLLDVRVGQPWGECRRQTVSEFSLFLLLKGLLRSGKSLSSDFKKHPTLSKIPDPALGPLFHIR